MAYQRPMVTVDQNMTIAPTSIERDQPAFIFGPNYELHRYSNDEEKSSTAVGNFDGTEKKIKYPGVIDEDAVDTEYTKLHGDNVVVELSNLTPNMENATLIETGVPVSVRAENGGFTKLLFAGKVYVDRDVKGRKVTRDTSLPRNLATGDILLVSYKESGNGATTSTIKTNIVDVKYSSDAWNIDSDSSTEGVAGTLVTIEDAIPETADTDSVKVKLIGVMNGVEFTRKNISEGSGYQWEQGKYIVKGKTFKGIKVNALNVLVSGFFADPEYCPVLYADLFVTFRELIVSYADTFHSVMGASEVAKMLGKIDPDNPLAMGVYMAALNSDTDDGDEAPPVYFMSVPSDDKDGYNAVLNKATLNDRVYVFAPTTRDEAVLELVRSHVLEMSTKTVKMWRIAAASALVPSEVAKLSAAMDPQGDEFLAIPVSDGGIQTGLTGYNKFRVVKAVDNVNGNTDTSLRSTVIPGDRVRFCFRNDAWGDAKYATYVVNRVINNYTVEVDEDIDVTDLVDGTSSYVPEKIEIYHTYTATESAEVIASVSKAMASRRMLNIFPSVFKSDGMTMTGEFAACAVAGLISATEPQQPITNVTVRGIDDIPLVYQTYNKTELDTIAAGGTFIVAQDLPNDLVYVRHQITTAYPDGNLNTAELSITKNVDSISYAFSEVFRPYYGKYNINPELVAILENLAGQLISQFGGSTSVYGPQLITDETEIKYIRQNQVMKDHVDIAITLGVPYPCNNIDIVLTV